MYYVRNINRTHVHVCVWSMNRVCVWPQWIWMWRVYQLPGGFDQWDVRRWEGAVLVLDMSLPGWYITRATCARWTHVIDNGKNNYTLFVNYPGIYTSMKDESCGMTLRGSRCTHWKYCITHIITSFFQLPNQTSIQPVVMLIIWSFSNGMLFSKNSTTSSFSKVLVKITRNSAPLNHVKEKQQQQKQLG